MSPESFGRLVHMLRADIARMDVLRGLIRLEPVELPVTAERQSSYEETSSRQASGWSAGGYEGEDGIPGESLQETISVCAEPQPRVGGLSSMGQSVMGYIEEPAKETPARGLFLAPTSIFLPSGPCLWWQRCSVTIDSRVGRNHPPSTGIIICELQVPLLAEKLREPPPLLCVCYCCSYSATMTYDHNNVVLGRKRSELIQYLHALDPNPQGRCRSCSRMRCIPVA